MLPLCRYALIGQMLIGCPVCDLLGLDRHCQGRLLVGNEFINTYDQGGIHFFSIASAAANFRSTCGSERGAPECRTQRSPAATPHVGQGTEDNCSGVSSFLFILTECPNTLPRNRSVLNIGVHPKSWEQLGNNCCRNRAKTDYQENAKARQTNKITAIR
jgi:hypothetical protein